jgi:hypothetical protein
LKTYIKLRRFVPILNGNGSRRYTIRCTGLVLTKKLETYQVTEAQLEKLRSDPWVVIEQDVKKEPDRK